MSDRLLEAWRKSGSVRWVVLAAVAATAGVGCNTSSTPLEPGADADIGRDGGVDGGSFTVEPDTLQFDRAQPNSGPPGGGNLVVLRGRGFVDDARVFFGDARVQPADTCSDRLPACDPFRLSVIAPAGAPGPVAIRIEIGEPGAEDFQTVTAPGAYTYEAISVSPSEGSVVGGTLLRVLGTGTSFEAGDTVAVGGLDCTNVVVETPGVLTCRTPPGDAGTVDVVVDSGGTELVAADAFTYRDTASPDAGGLGGGPIEGTLNVTVINAQTGLREPEVFVMVGDDPTTPWRGFTDPSGQVVFSGPDLQGPVTLHASKDCFERTSFVSFDARDVTIFLFPWQVPPGHRCAPPPSPAPPPPGGPGRLGSALGGILRWQGANEFGLNDWDNIPEPARGYERVAYVYTTQVCEGGDRGCQNPFTMVDPFAPRPEFVTRIEEDTLPPGGALGWPFLIFARPGSYAVWAIAGLEREGEGTDPFTGLPARGDFKPYVMGVARDVIAGPGETVDGIEVLMNIPLDATLDVELDGLPPSVPTGPNTYRARAFIDLGAEGFISRTVGDVVVGGFFLLEDVYLRELPDGLDTVQSLVRRPLRFWAQPALTGALEDARYRVSAGWYTDAIDDLLCGQTSGHMPCTERILTGVRDTRGALRIVEADDDWLAMPVAVDPASPGGNLAGDRVVRWDLGEAKPDFQWVIVQDAEGFPAWRLIVEGNVQEATLPDLSTIPTLRDLPSGQLSWIVIAARRPGACPRSPDCEAGVNSFNEWTYRDLSARTWTHTSANFFTANVPAR